MLKFKLNDDDNEEELRAGVEHDHDNEHSEDETPDARPLQMQKISTSVPLEDIHGDLMNIDSTPKKDKNLLEIDNIGTPQK